MRADVSNFDALHWSCVKFDVDVASTFFDVDSAHVKTPEHLTSLGDVSRDAGCVKGRVPFLAVTPIELPWKQSGDAWCSI